MRKDGDDFFALQSHTAHYFSEPVPQHYCFRNDFDLGWGRIGERDVLGWRKENLQAATFYYGIEAC